MLVVPVEEITLPVIAAMNNGVAPKVDPLEHSSFVYHGPGRPGELMPTILVQQLLSGDGFVAVEVPIIIQKKGDVDDAQTQDAEDDGAAG